MTLRIIAPPSTPQADRRVPFNTTLLVLCCLLAGCFLSACSGGQGKASTSQTYKVAPAFREFYHSLGANEVLGAAISQPFDFDQYECQYTVNVLMCQNPLLSAEERFFLFPLGAVIKLPGASETQPDQNAGEAQGELSVYEEFIPFLQQFSAAHFAGDPISPPSINYAQQRIEQYFENIGLYRSFSDTPGTIKLLAYGAYACSQVCNYLPSVDAALLDPSLAAVDQPFLPALGAVDGSAVLGTPLTQPYIAKDGSMEQVYTNTVLYSPADDPKKVALRPLPEILGVPRQEPAAQAHGSDENMVFYPVKNGLGYHVPSVFDTFIVNHGGRRFSGDPLSETVEISPGVYRQCFTYYCLLYNPSLSEQEQVNLAPLGQQYYELMKSSESGLSPTVISNDTVTLVVNEQYPMLTGEEPQRIEIRVTKTEDQSAMAGIEASLELLLPDGEHYSSDFPPTAVDGKAVLEIVTPKKALNGSILTYQVCLKNPALEPVCAQGSYLLWKTP